MAVHDSGFFAGTDGNVFRSTDGGTSWNAVGAGITGNNVYSFARMGSLLFAGTGGAGVWVRPISEMTTSAPYFRDHAVSPGTLEQNYPNPFNPTTIIQFSLHRDEFVTLDIYDVLGKVVARLVADNLPAGKHKFEWTTHQLPSGVYYSRLRTSTFTQTRKLLLIK
ncbi:MAG: hypothetical protein A2X67_13750 [Ignavibacteria bacterium GWA2_55_11]|nr:MAG: hypothetical protein A2X67_13750 [Ignavibacteria bacterium GWA2_55_11]